MHFILAPIADVNPCVPTPCGPYSNCKVVNDHGVCSCREGYVGTPPTCRPECVISTDCPQHQACIKQKCRDPCPGTCGVNARCQVINHNPICTCNAGFTGDPFVTCQLEQSKNIRKIINEAKLKSSCFNFPVNFDCFIIYNFLSYFFIFLFIYISFFSISAFLYFLCTIFLNLSYFSVFLRTYRR